MKPHLAFAATMAALFFAIPAHAAVMVVGEGPERGCYLDARTQAYTNEALQLCNNAIANSSLTLHDRAATFVNRGVILLGMGKVDTAMVDFNECLRIMPDQGDAYLNRGAAYIALKQYSNALTEIQKSFPLHPTDMAVAYYDRAVAEEDLGQLRDAFNDYQEAAKEQPTFIAANEAVSRFRVITKAAKPPAS